jgi:hypothetical protein
MTTTTAPAATTPGTVVRRRPSPHRWVAAAGVLLTGAAALAVSAAAGTDATPREPVPMVEDGRWGGPDVYEPRDEPGPRHGSADSLERAAS